jgi:hypothetical protein
MSNQGEPQEQGLQETYRKRTVFVFFTVFLTLILATKALDLWAILIPEFSRLVQYFMVNMYPQLTLVARSQTEFVQNLTGQVLSRGELPYLEAGSCHLTFGPKIKNIFAIGACDVSVIIPALNEERYLPRCLESLSGQSREGQFEIIVVDGGSTDQTVEVAKEHADKVIVEPSRVGVARNLGAKHAEGKILAFVDADTIACERWIDEIARTLDSSTNAAGVTGPTLPYEGTKLDKLAYHVATGWAQRLSLKLGRPHVAGFNCAYRRDPFWDAGGFDEKNQEVRLPVSDDLLRDQRDHDAAFWPNTWLSAGPLRGLGTIGLLHST